MEETGDTDLKAPTHLSKCRVCAFVFVFFVTCEGGLYRNFSLVFPLSTSRPLSCSPFPRGPLSSSASPPASPEPLLHTDGRREADGEGGGHGEGKPPFPPKQQGGEPPPRPAETERERVREKAPSFCFMLPCPFAPSSAGRPSSFLPTSVLSYSSFELAPSHCGASSPLWPAAAARREALQGGGGGEEAPQGEEEARRRWRRRKKRPLLSSLGTKHRRAKNGEGKRADLLSLPPSPPPPPSLIP